MKKKLTFHVLLQIRKLTTVVDCTIINPFGSRNFAEKCVLKLVERFSSLSGYKELKLTTKLFTGRGVTIHIPCDSIRFRLLPFDFRLFRFNYVNVS